MWEEIPRWEEIAVHLAFNFLLCDLGDYFNHRLFHIPILYKNFHKQHHEFTTTVGVTASYGILLLFPSFI
jgi:sterol desaturase/sphingolipid hydroxylase (fatty acid hydroxylase superfamily)